MGSRAQRAAALVRDHHDAYLVEVFGYKGSGIPVDRIRDLIARGLIDVGRVGMEGAIKVGPVYADPFMFRDLVGRTIARAPHEDYPEMRRWPLERWQDEIQAAGGAFPFEPSTSPAEPTNEPPGVPGGLGPSDAGAWQAAQESAASYIRGLGNESAGALEATVAEVWEGETPIEIPIQDRRNERVREIRALTARAVAEKWTSQKLASEIGHAIGEWGRGLERIATTELQGAHNEGRVRDAAATYGSGAGIARIPEAGACDACRGLFLGPGGKPVVFSISELIANGTNVGLRAQDWKATVFPIHPFCRCDTMPVPPGFEVLADGRLRRKQPDAV